MTAVLREAVEEGLWQAELQPPCEITLVSNHRKWLLFGPVVVKPVGGCEDAATWVLRIPCVTCGEDLTTMLCSQHRIVIMRTIRTAVCRVGHDLDITLAHWEKI